MVALVGVFLVAAFRVSDSLIQDVFLGSLCAAVTGVFVWWTRSMQTFAERNPAQAMLDGGEFLAYPTRTAERR